MGARIPLIIVGAVLMFVSLLLPTIFFPNVDGDYFGQEVDGFVYYWMAGQIYAWVIEESSMGTRYHTWYSGFRPDPFGITCMLLIIVGGILALALGNATESKVAFIGGLLGLIGTFVFYASVYAGLFYTRVGSIVSDGYTPVPFVGFFLCIVGSILALVRGALEKY